MSALYNFTAESKSEVSLQYGDRILEIDPDSTGSGWSFVRVASTDRFGWAPSSYLRPLVVVAALPPPSSSSSSSSSAAASALEEGGGENSVYLTFHRKFIPQLSDLYNYLIQYGRVVRELQIITDVDRCTPYCKVVFGMLD